MLEEEHMQLDENGNYVIDFNNKQMNESWFNYFGTAVKYILKKMFGYQDLPNFIIKGKKSDVQAFTSALTKEKKYMDTYMKHGLNSPQTIKNKSKLKSAVSKFERTTGLKWPFKFK